MLDVFFTVDVEVWCDGWNDLDAKFPDAFRRYVYGPTARGHFGLPYTLDVLAAHGLHGVFFVEPLFALRFGDAPLQEIVALLRERGQEVQLHLHTEWADEAREPLIEGMTAKRQFLRDFSRAEQEKLLDRGRGLLERAGAPTIGAFRAGGFGFNRDTLLALSQLGIGIDSSYNATLFGPDSGVAPGRLLRDAHHCDGVLEIPMTVYDDGSGKLRHVQLTACSSAEIEGLLWQALEAGQSAFCILSHNFELLDASKTRADRTVVRRLHALCEFLERERGSFSVRGFADLDAAAFAQAPAASAPQLRSPLWKTGGRLAEQAWRRFAR